MNNFFRIISTVVLCGFLAINMTGCKKKSKSANPVGSDVSLNDNNSSEKFSKWDKDAEIRAAIEDKDYNKSGRLAKERIEKNPKDSKAYYFLGKTYLAQENFDESKTALETALEFEPDNRNYKRELSICLMAMADKAMDKDLPTDAITFLKKVRANNYKTELTEQKLAKAYKVAGEQLIKSGNVDEAETLFNQAINMLPDAPEIRVSLAKLLINSDRLMEANRLLSGLIETNPKFADGLILYAKLLQKMGELDEARNIIDRAQSVSPDNAEIKSIKESLSKGAINNSVTVIPPTTAAILTPDEAKEQVIALEKTENYQEEIDFLTTYLQSSPDQDWAKLKLASACIKVNKNDIAIAKINEFLVKNPDNTEALLLKATCLKQKNRLTEALEILTNLSLLNTDRNDIKNVLGEVYARLGKFDKALEIWKTILQKEPENSETLFNIGQLNAEMSKFKEAQEYFEKAIHNEPFNAKFRYFTGINLIHSGHKADAISLWESSRGYLNANDPYSNRILSALGDVNDSEKNLQSTPPSLSASINENTEPSTAVSNSEISEAPESEDYTKALEYARGGFYPEAIAGFERVIKNDPNNFNALINLGRVYTATRKQENACAYYLKALKLEPKNIFALRSLANSYSELGLHKLASEITNQVKQRAPDQLQGFPRYKVTVDYIRNNPRAYIPVTKAFLQAGLQQEALALVKTGIKEVPGEPKLYVLEGDVLKSQGDYSNALASYKVALEKDPQSPLAYLKIGDLYSSSSQLTDAVAEYKKALKANFIDADTMLEIVDRFEKLGQVREARKVLGRLKGMNLNQSQISKLEGYLGTKIEVEPNGGN